MKNLLRHQIIKYNIIIRPHRPCSKKVVYQHVEFECSWLPWCRQEALRWWRGRRKVIVFRVIESKTNASLSMLIISDPSDIYIFTEIEKKKWKGEWHAEFQKCWQSVWTARINTPGDIILVIHVQLMCVCEQYSFINMISNKYGIVIHC